jgi:hypothetical protein
MGMRSIICHLRPVRLYCNFPHYLINSKIFERKVFQHKIFVLIFSTNFSHIFLILKRIQWDMIKHVYSSSYKYLMSCQTFTKLEFCRHIFQKYPTTKFHGNAPGGSREFCARMDGRTDMTKLMKDFRNFEKGLKNCTQNTKFMKHLKYFSKYPKFSTIIKQV